MGDLVSIIIPFYNVEDYIEECLKSVINQTYKNLEIICVDDCSPDNSYIIVNKYIDIDKRIKLIRHKENLGLGGARNTGLQNANGKFVYFLDSDDYIEIDDIDALFQPYEKGTKGQFGLGLSIVYKTCTMYGYNVTAVNHETGVSFIITKKENQN